MASPHVKSPLTEPPQFIRDKVAKGVRVTLIGVVISAVLATVKIAGGLLGNSYALVADGVESLLDIFSALLVLGGLIISTAPRTDRFPYGLGKAEPLAALAVAIVLLIASVGIAISAIREVLTPQYLPAPFTLVILVGVVIVKEFMFRKFQMEGSEIGSRAVVTDAWHHRSDALTSLAAFVGIAVALIMGEGYESADDWAALVACGIIGFNGFRLLKVSLQDILDVSAPRSTREAIRKIVISIPEVEGIDVLWVRGSGLSYLVDIHVEVDGSLSVQDGHAIAHIVKDRLMTSDLPILDVLVHIEPAGPGPTQANAS
ncbi:MAG: cation diffusion facilitator family transporter [Rhodothermales bacterium]